MTSILDVKLVKIDYDASDVKDAIILCLKLLLKNGYIKKQYILETLKNYDKFGPYFYLGKGIAMPHARPEHGVIKTGISLLRLKNAIPIGKNNKLVWMFIGLCSVSDTDHIDIMSKIATKIGDEKIINAIRSSKNSDEISNIFN